jgi:hypothetical protein
MLEVSQVSDRLTWFDGRRFRANRTARHPNQDCRRKGFGRQLTAVEQLTGLGIVRTAHDTSVALAIAMQLG